MKKSTFDFEPRLLEHEGQVVRINFCVEKVTETFPSMGDGEDIKRDVFKAYVLRLPQPITVDAIKSALIAEQFEESTAEAIAAEVVLTAVQGGELSGNTLALAKQMVAARIDEYDKSENVNQFTLNDNPMWLDDAMRTKLAKRFGTDEQDGLSETKLIYDGVPFDLPIAMAKAMLHQIESYARDCFDKTNEHKAAVNALDDVDAVLQYDFTAGYPEKLSFNV